jgi:hypothetical protein
MKLRQSLSSFLRRGARLSTAVTLLLITGITWILVFALTGFDYPLLHDEVNYHLPAVQLFSSSLSSASLLFQAIRDYSGAGGPLPYVIMALVGRVFGLNIAVLRFVSSIFALGAVWFFFLILQELGREPGGRLPGAASSSRGQADVNGQTGRSSSGAWLLAALLLFFWPYFFTYGFTILTHIYALFFGLGGIYLFLRFLREERLHLLLLSGLLLMASVLCRQTYFAYAVGTAIWEGVYYIRRHKPLRLLLPLSAVPAGLALLGLVVIWHGLVPPSFQSRNQLQPSVESLGLALISCATFLCPAILALKGRRSMLLPGLLVASAVYGVGVWQTGSVFPLTSRSIGIVSQTLAAIQNRVGWLALSIELILMWLGASLLAMIVKSAWENHRVFVLILLLLSLGAAFGTSRLNEVYLVQVMPWLLVLVLPLVPQKVVRAAWLIAEILLAVIFFYVRVYLWTAWGLA